MVKTYKINQRTKKINQSKNNILFNQIKKPQIKKAMRKLIFLFVITLFFSYCKNETNNNKKPPTKESIKKIEPLAFAKKSYSLQSELCKNEEEMQCAEVKIDYLNAKDGEESIRKKINQSIEEKLANMFIDGEQQDVKNISFEKAAQGFIADYEAFVKEDGNDNFITPYANETTCEILFDSPELLCIAFANYSNTGGAHGNYFTDLVNFNKKTGDIIQPKEILKNKAQLSKLLEQQAKKHYRVPEGQNLKDFGLYYEGNDFPVNDNIGILQDSLIFEYNPYEVGPYVLGGMSLKVAKTEVKDLLLSW